MPPKPPIKQDRKQNPASLAANTDEVMAQLASINQNLKSPPAGVSNFENNEGGAADAMIDNIRAKLDQLDQIWWNSVSK